MSWMTFPGYPARGEGRTRISASWLEVQCSPYQCLPSGMSEAKQHSFLPAALTSPPLHQSWRLDLGDPRPQPNSAMTFGLWVSPIIKSVALD